MSRSPVVALIAKDVYLYRWMTLGSLVAGLAALPLLGAGGTLSILGMILFVTVMGVHSAIVAAHGPLSERQTHTLALVLSLPVSPLQAAMARIAASLVSYSIPWGVLFLVLVSLQLALPAEQSNLPYTVGLMVFLLANFCVLLAMVMIGRSELWCIAGLIGSNTAVPVFMNSVLLTLAPWIEGEKSWSPALLLTLAGLLATALLALSAIVFVHSRRRDFL